MPRPAKARLPVTSAEGAQAIYFPACISRLMGALPGEPAELSLPEVLVALARRGSQGPAEAPLVPFYLRETDAAVNFPLAAAHLSEALRKGVAR